MVCEDPPREGSSSRFYVLILVLMEYGLRDFNVLAILQNLEVLILVLMEYGLRDVRSKRVRS